MAFYNLSSDHTNSVISFSQAPQQDFGIFAKGYIRAANALAEHLLGQPSFSDYAAHLVVFLYRRAFELYLKGLYFRAGLILAFHNNQSMDFKSINQNRLTPSALVFSEICRKLFPSDHELSGIASRIQRHAAEFEELDKNSFGYRYPIDMRGGRSIDPHQIVNLRAMHNGMKPWLQDLEIIEAGFTIEASRAQEIYELVQEAKAIPSSRNSEVD